MIWGITQATRVLGRRTAGTGVGASGGTLGQGDGVAVGAIGGVAVGAIGGTLGQSEGVRTAIRPRGWWLGDTKKLICAGDVRRIFVLLLNVLRL